MQTSKKKKKNGKISLFEIKYEINYNILIKCWNITYKKYYIQRNI